VLLKPLPYHYRLRDFLKTHHKDVWDWFSSVTAISEAGDAIHLELLKTTYRLDRENHATLYQLADSVSEQFELNAPVTLYQSQDGGGVGQAALYFTPDHGHVVFGGKILELLDESERRALLGHELAHFKLWTEENGEFLVVDQLLNAVLGDPRSEASHFASARFYRLFTEIYADRGALAVSQSAQTVVSTLVKTVTGTTSVNPDSYLAQAEEILAKTEGIMKSETFTHPEVFIRARSLALWSRKPDQDTESEIERLIVGGWSLDELDLTQQERLEQLTREVILHLLRPPWVRTEATLAHAKLFFANFQVDTPSEFDTLESLANEFTRKDDKTEHYLAHILLDFAVADRELDDAGLAHAFLAAEKLGVAKTLELAVRKELKLKKSEVTALRKKSAELVEKVSLEA
jgi:Peptidase family M48